MKKRRETLSFKYKILAAQLFTLFIAFGTFVYFSYKTFSADKRLYILDLDHALLDATNSSMTLELMGRLQGVEPFLRQVFTDYFAKKKMEDSLFDSLPVGIKNDLIAISVYGDDSKGLKPDAYLANSGLLAKWHLSPETLQAEEEKYTLPLKDFEKTRELRLINRSFQANTPSGPVEVPIVTFLLSGGVPGSDQKLIAAVDFGQEFLQKALKRSELADLFLINSAGELVSHPDLDALVKYAHDPYPHPVVGQIKNAKFSSESSPFKIGKDTYLVTWGETGFRDVYIVSQVNQRTAFLALSFLMNKTALAAALIAYLATLISLFLARRLTIPLKRLKSAVEMLGTGNTNVKLEIQSRDEIGLVAESFTWMASQVNGLMEAASDKGRMESELKTAHLVQANLMRELKMASESFDVDSFTSPARECGGDYCESFVLGNKLTLIVGDATGHGASAAIITALIKGALSTLRTFGGMAKLDPGTLLVVLNRVLYEACGGQLLMTMCVAQLDLETGVIHLASAGHESPIRTSFKNPEGGRGSWHNAEPLFVRGELLGFRADSKFTAKSFQLAPGDTVLFFTDGLLDAKNAQDTPWGDRTLRKTLSAMSSYSLAEIKGTIASQVLNYIHGRPQDDDFTLLLLRWKSAAAPAIPKKAA